MNDDTDNYTLRLCVQEGNSGSGWVLAAAEYLCMFALTILDARASTYEGTEGVRNI